MFETGRLKVELQNAGPALLSGLRLWASVCLAMYVAFWLELDEPSWAGTAAAIVFQTTLGASLRKSWFRLVGTVVGGIAIVILTACFPQDRVLFFLSLALWGGLCAFVSTVLRNFAAYAAALAGYTAAIIASDQLGAVGGLDGDVFLLAVTRVTEIGIGILSAGVVLAGTDTGRARQRLTTLVAALAAGITTNFYETLQTTGPSLQDTRPCRRDFLRRVIALDPIVDHAVGESSEIRYHSLVLLQAIDGLLDTLSGWRAIANHLVLLPHDQAQAEAAIVARNLPTKLVSLLDQQDLSCWLVDPAGLRRTCEAGIHKMIVLDVKTPSLRLLADKAAEALAGLVDALNGLAMLAGDPAMPATASCSHLHVPDWLPALVNAVRTVLTILVATAFWIITAWSSGAEAITFAAISSILFAARADGAYVNARGFVTGICIAAVAAAVTSFSVLPNLETFGGFCLAIGLWLVPACAVAIRWPSISFNYMASYFVPLLAPTNQMSFDTVQFYNDALAIISGAGAAALFFCIIPPLSPAFRVRRLLALTLADLRRLAQEQAFHDWAGHVHSRISAMPAEAMPLQRSHLLAALSLGIEILRLSSISSLFNINASFTAALTALARGKSTIAVAELRSLDEQFAIHGYNPEALRARGSIIVISEVLNAHAAYFDGGRET
ncbi:putative membrane protein YccC [Bradyrhizobium japonicum]|uniref:FUSC family protein n=1 Tax=Bradyrhizobium japonicum TaxID=375 RepID=UPI0021684CF3|nr:FUSC family protein [Bradyrhizobium japonicum]MCS3496156.1 putative membrane protein YccC [Bradyrhizobium japonicum]MCS3961682.1 putative membrane protein YccC [Bradyrhizobium japonicum]MCS3993999.1 putative membrane protein YccC [Bradyrhizobium japonicum]